LAGNGTKLLDENIMESDLVAHKDPKDMLVAELRRELKKKGLPTTVHFDNFEIT
jgi:hypothetical protein